MLDAVLQGCGGYGRVSLQECDDLTVFYRYPRRLNRQLMW